LKLGLLGFGTKTSATMESFSHDWRLLQLPAGMRYSSVSSWKKHYLRVLFLANGRRMHTTLVSKVWVWIWFFGGLHASSCREICSMFRPGFSFYSFWWDLEKRTDRRYMSLCCPCRPPLMM
jgi:hypothetical protein